MIVELSPNDELIVRFNGTDGEFSIHFDSEEFPNAIVVEETGGYSDDMGRRGILYREVFIDEDSIPMCGKRR
jgi:hypothetical protein